MPYPQLPEIREPLLLNLALFVKSLYQVCACFFQLYNLVRSELSGIVVQEMVRPIPLLGPAEKNNVCEDFSEAVQQAARRLIADMQR